jgi:hypothetical protein
VTHSDAPRLTDSQCDRKLPCSNCVSRHKQASCQYDTISHADGYPSGTAATESSNNDSLDSEPRETGEDSLSKEQLVALGYSNSIAHNSFGIYEKIEAFGKEHAPLDPYSITPKHDYNSTKDKYKIYIRQLPSKQYLDLIVASFFRCVNYLYDQLDEDIFRERLDEWTSLPFRLLNQGMQELSPELRSFPALLFQVLALGLQFQPSNYDAKLDGLKYNLDMGLEDLAVEFSETGYAVLILLGKRDMTMSSVQAGLLRTSFLKNCGQIIEAWHSLGQTVRDAQEMGLHKQGLEYHPTDPQKAIKASWDIELRRRCWITLQLWDAHMALVLGRPSCIDTPYTKYIFPIDAAPASNRNLIPPLPRNPTDPPTPLTSLVWNCHVTEPLREILNLAGEGAQPKSYARIQTIHQTVLHKLSLLPPFFRFQSPDTSFDTLPSCPWLPVARAQIFSSASFTLMALHRPYIFSIPASRLSALKAALNLLIGQKSMFGLMNESHHTMFSLVFSTFDAVILVAAVYIMFPAENRELLPLALRHYEWAMERFGVMAGRNRAAKAALGVARAVHARLMRALGRKEGGSSDAVMDFESENLAFGIPSLSSENSALDPQIETGSLTAHTRDFQGQILDPALASIDFDLPITEAEIQHFSSVTSSSLGAGLGFVPTPTSLPADPNAGIFSVPENFDFNAMQPLMPFRDLMFNDLGLVGGAGVEGRRAEGGFLADGDAWIGEVGSNNENNAETSAPWMFGGGFPDDSFWGLMNAYNPQ